MTPEKPKKRKQPPKQWSLWQFIAIAFVGMFLVFLMSVNVFGIFTDSEPRNDPYEPVVPDWTIPRRLPDNLISNPSFETNPSETIWDIEPRNTNLSSEWTDEMAKTGDYAIKLQTSTTGNQGWAGWFTKIPITDGYSYTFSAETYSPDGASGWLSIELWDNDDTFLIGYSTGCSRPSEGWVRKEVDVVPENYREEDATYMRLGLQQCLNYSEGELTTLYFDDVALVATQSD